MQTRAAPAAGFGARPSQRHLRDPAWRLNNLYFIKPKMGPPAVMRMKPAQRLMLEALLEGKRRLITPKARQAGISTMSAMLALDMMLFSPGTSVGVVHLTDDKAADMIRMMRFAYERLPEWLRDEVKLKSDQTRRIEFSNGSSVVGGINLRGSSFQFLIVSELAPIEANSAVKATEIRDGLFPTVPQDGIIICESTSRGPQGIYWSLTMQAVRDAEQREIALRRKKAWHGGSGFHALFFPWYIEPEYRAPVDAGTERDVLDSETVRYFKELQQELRRSGSNIRLDPGQALWYQRQKLISGVGIYQEFPSRLSEAFMAVSEDAIYSDQLLQAYSDQRISSQHAPHARFGPVYVSFDLGGKTKHSDHTALTFAQFDGQYIRFVHGFKAKWGNFDDFVEYIIEWSRVHRLRIGALILPHDARNAYRGTDRTVEELLQQADVAPVCVVPKTESRWGDITIVQNELHYSTFWVAPADGRLKDDGCRVLLNDLRAYRRKKNRATGLVEDAPHHGPESDACDSLRYLVMAKYAGVLTDWVFEDAFDGHTFGNRADLSSHGFAPQRGGYGAMRGRGANMFQAVSGTGGGFGTVADD